MTTEELLAGTVTEDVESGVYRVLNDGGRDFAKPNNTRASRDAKVANPARECKGDAAMRGIVIVGAATAMVGSVAMAPRARGAAWEGWLTKLAA